MTELFQTGGLVQDIKTLRDRGHRIVYHTNELPKERVADLHGFYQEPSFLALAAKPHKEMFVPDKLLEIPEGKTPSQRLRNVLYLQWKRQSRNVSFEGYYAQRMEEIIAQEKREL